MNRLFARLRNQNYTLLTVALLVIDVVFFTITDPNAIASPLLIVGFLLMAVTMYVLLQDVLQAGRAFGLVKQGTSTRGPLFISIGLGIIIALQSVGELTIRDIIVLFLLELFSYLYVSYGQR